MKLLLYKTFSALSLNILADLLSRKKSPHWIYVYYPKSGQYLKVQRENYMNVLIACQDFVSTIDYGERFENERGNPIFIEGCYFPTPDELRYDRELIEMVESCPEKYVRTLRVMTVPIGDKYRIIEDYTTGYESLEIESEIDWKTADY